MPAINENSKISVKILLMDGQAFMREVITNALALGGYRDIRTVGNIAALGDSLDALFPDLLILDADIADGDTLRLVHQIRMNRQGRNPFVPIILTSWRSDKILVRQVVDSGVDAFLVKPFSASLLFDRIDLIVKRRKPFIVTADYFGPDRRQASRPGGPEPFDVPNTLKEKAGGTDIDLSKLIEDIDLLMRDMRQQRLSSVMNKVVGIFRELEDGPDEGVLPEELALKFQKLMETCDGLTEEIGETRFRYLEKQVCALAKFLRGIGAEGWCSAQHDLQRIRSHLEPICTETGLALALLSKDDEPVPVVAAATTRGAVELDIPA